MKKPPEDDQTSPIEPPDRNQPTDRVRTVATALAGLVLPGGGFVTTLIDDLVPTGAEKERERWEDDISARTNQHSEQIAAHDEQLNPKEHVSGLVAHLAVALAQACPDGLAAKRYTPEEVYALVPDRRPEEVDDAAWELEALGLVRMTSLMGPIAWRLGLTPEFYTQLDHQIMGWSTAQDAVELAELILAEDETSADILHEKTGWTKRRFNPALRSVLQEIPESRISQAIQPDYVAPYFALTAADKVNLRRLSSQKNV